VSEDPRGDRLLPQSAALQIAAGSLAGPVVRRVVRMLAARADIVVADLEAVVSVSEALGQACAGRTADSRLGLRIETEGGRLRVTFGPLSSGEGPGAVADARKAVGENGRAGALAGDLHTVATSEGDYVEVQAGR
jgi:hypothetical protein